MHLQSRTLLATIVLVSAILVVAWLFVGMQSIREPIKVGILHSNTGTMAISERSVRDATLMAIEEINTKGGIAGRRIKPVIVDGQSDPQVFATAAERLIQNEKVSVVFGCWTSASRRTAKAVFEENNHLLFYPVQYEGLEQSPNIVYTGAAPNQQIIPAVKWCFDQLDARKFFLVGSDYVFPRTANEIIRAQVKALKGTVVGEQYILLGSNDVNNLVQEIKTANPDVILNTINGDSNVAFFAALRKAGITPNIIPTMSFSIAEDELRSMDASAMAGDYATWNYFQSIQRKENIEYVQRFKAKYGSERVTDDPIEAGYYGVYLWAQAVEDAGTAEPSAVRRSLPNQSFAAPQGIVSIDAENQHTWKTVRISRIQPDGQFEVVWTSEHPVRPVPYPIFQTRKQWGDFLDKMYADWGNRWSNPGN